MTVQLKIPEIGESIQEVHVAHWLKREGDHVHEDEDIVELETDKASMELAAPATGVIKEIVKDDGADASVGETIAIIEDEPEAAGEEAASQQDRKEPVAKDQPHDEDQKAEPSKPAKKTPQPSRKQQEPEAQDRATKRQGPKVPATPSARRELRKHGLSAEDVPPSGKKLRRQDVVKFAEERAADKPARQPRPAEPQPPARPTEVQPKSEREPARDEHVVPLSPIRKRIGQRLVQAQQEAALLTTFNEVDMSAVIGVREKYGEAFREKHGVKLGFMSFFVRATVEALRDMPQLNGEIRGDNIVLHDARHIGIAVATERGLVVPVLRSAEDMNCADIERLIADFAARADNGKLEPGELQGGTFTISNGGVFGSLFSTPIVNPPQSGVLGMHAIEQRPVGRNGEIVLRPMMYLALTYDHRLVDGREALTILNSIKPYVEDPVRILLDV